MAAKNIVTRSSSKSNDKSSSSSSSSSKSSSSMISLLSSSSFILLLLIIFLIRVIVIANDHWNILVLSRHNNKLYDSFNSFFPFYKTQHTNEYSNLLHYIGTSIFLITSLTDIRILLSYIIAMIAGVTVHPITIHSSHGAIEALAMFGTYLTSVNILSGLTALLLP